MTTRLGMCLSMAVLVAACGGGGGSVDAADPIGDASSGGADAAPGSAGIAWTVQRNGVAATCDDVVWQDAGTAGDLELELVEGDNNYPTAEARVSCLDGRAVLAAPAGDYRLDVRFGALTGDQYSDGELYVSEPVTFPLTADHPIVLNQVDVTWTWDATAVPDCAGNFMRIELELQAGFNPSCADGSITPEQGGHAPEGTWGAQAIVGPAVFPTTYNIEVTVPPTGGEIALDIP